MTPLASPPDRDPMWVLVRQTVMRTLEAVAARAPMTPEQLRENASEVGRLRGWERRGWPCPVCEKDLCDPACPLEPVRQPGPE